MKTIKFLMIAAICVVITGCMNKKDWDSPDITVSPYGNNNITEENIISIASLLADADYQDAFRNNKSKLVTKDIKIRGRVTGNDVGGNIYKQFALQDATGAIIISVNQGGLNGFLPEGQEVIIDLKGLYVGGYGRQPQVGAPYNGGIGRMSKDLFNEHFKAIGGLHNVNPAAIAPTDFSTIVGDIDNNAGKLVILKGVSFTGADGVKTLTDGATSGGNFVNTYVKVGGKDIIIRTSTYADFAKMIMPMTPVDITGIATRYNSDWQIMMRKTVDIQPAVPNP